MNTVTPARAFAIEVMQRVMQGRSLSDEFTATSFLKFSLQDQSWIKALSLGVCRHYFVLHALLQSRLKKPFKNKDKKIELILMIAIYELLFMQTPHYACVSQYVSLTGTDAKWAKGLANAILRGIIRDQEKKQVQLSGFNRFPDWWIKTVEHDWPNESNLILQEDQDAPPLILRINKNKISWDDYEKLLHQENLSAKQFQSAIEELHLTAMEVSPAVPVQHLPKFNEGFVSVQDVSAQYAAHVLKPEAKMQVLDACAAPGGKTAHLLELYPEIVLTAIDIDEKRAQKIRENVSRLQLSSSVNILVNNAVNVSEWWNGVPFDRILLDAPCSASGVVRRHPDIKLLRQENDIAQCAALQLQLLKAIWPTLKKQGELLYSTCSIFKAENEDVIAEFFSEQPDAEIVPLPEIGMACRYGQQRLPGVQEGDGFYYAKIRKV